MENIRNEQFYDDNGKFMDIYEFLRINPNTTTDEVLRQINEVKGYLRAESLSNDEEIQAQIRVLDFFDRVFTLDRVSYDTEYAKVMTAPAPTFVPEAGKKLTPEQIEQLLSSMAKDPDSEPTPEPDVQAKPVAEEGKLTQEEFQKLIYNDGIFRNIYTFLGIDSSTPTETIIESINDEKEYIKITKSAKEAKEQIEMLNSMERLFATDRESYDREYAKVMEQIEAVQKPLGSDQPAAEPAVQADPAPTSNPEPTTIPEAVPAATPSQNIPPFMGYPFPPFFIPEQSQGARGYTPDELNNIINAAIDQAIKQYQAQGAPTTDPEPTPVAPEPAPAPTTDPEPTPVAPEPAPTPTTDPEPTPVAPEPAPAPTADPEPTPDDEDDYETAEARARAAFDREQDEKIKKLKEKAEEKRQQAEELVNNAETTVDEAKATAEREKDEAKRAKDAVKEAKKTARKAKWDAFKAKRAEKKANKEIKKINKKRQKRNVLIRQPKGGIIMGAKEHWKQITAGVAATAVLIGGGFAIKHFILDADLENKNNNPSTSQDSTVDPTLTPTDPTATITPEQIQIAVEGVQENLDEVNENLDNLGMEEGYTAEDAAELVKFLNGQESTLTVDEANEMLENIVTSVVTPAINNALVGEKVYETQEINLASLLANDPAYEAVQAMEDYINGSIEHPEQLPDYARYSLEDQVLIINNEQTVDGFNITTTSPAARLVWANLAAGMNGLTGTLGEDISIEVDGVTYAHSEINNGTILQMVVNGAKKDLGLSAKTIDLK